MIRVLIVLLIFPFSIYSQGKAIIDDPDGYTNVRIKPAGKVIDKIYEHEIFTVQSKDGDWWSVELFNGTAGYVHNSRVEIIEIDNCSWCWDPNLYIPTPKGVLLGSGYRPERISKNKYLVSETRVGLLNQDQKQLEVPAVDHAFIDIGENEIIIELLVWLPKDNNWKMEFLPFKKFIISRNEPSDLQEFMVLSPAYQSADVLQNFLSEYTKSPALNAGEFEGAMYKLFMAAISGYPEAKDLLKNHNFVLDGHVQIDYGKLISYLSYYEENK